jgi:hypothetical protein
MNPYDFLMGGFGMPAPRTPEEREKEAREAREYMDKRLSEAVPWTPDIKWTPDLIIQARTYHPLRLFPVEPSNIVDPNKLSPEQMMVSPDGQWLYCEKILPRGESLRTMSGNRRGYVMFDGPVIIPALHSLRVEPEYGWAPGPDSPEVKWRVVGEHTYWKRDPWMSITPMELLSLRPGTKIARGDVIIAGLGLGHQLIEVSRRPQVRRLVLVEKSQGLLDFMMPAVEPHLARPVEIVVGDAYVVIPQMQADVALIDIFPEYGRNKYGCDRLKASSPGIRKFWCWGAA